MIIARARVTCVKKLTPVPRFTRCWIRPQVYYRGLCRADAGRPGSGDQVESRREDQRLTPPDRRHRKCAIAPLEAGALPQLCPRKLSPPTRYPESTQDEIDSDNAQYQD